jgi:hypothetical protein
MPHDEKKHYQNFPSGEHAARLRALELLLDWLLANRLYGIAGPTLTLITKFRKEVDRG